MGNLIKPSEYAKKMGISRQAVYAKIKKGILTSKSVEGKIYVVQERTTGANPTIKNDNPTPKSVNSRHLDPSAKSVDDLLAAKDETITVLKETITDLKETNKMITSTLRSEVDLLKEAFSEMKMLYSTRIEHLQIGESPLPEAATDFSTDEDEEVIFSEAQDADDDLAWIGLEDFFDEHNVRKQSKQDKIAKRLKKLFKKGDSRVDSFHDDWIVLADADFSDVLKKKK